MFFQLDFGCMIHSFKRYSGRRKVCLVLVPAVAGYMREMNMMENKERWTGLVGTRLLELGVPMAGQVPVPASFPDNSIIYLIHST